MSVGHVLPPMSFGPMMPFQKHALIRSVSVNSIHPSSGLSTPALLLSHSQPASQNPSPVLDTEHAPPKILLYFQDSFRSLRTLSHRSPLFFVQRSHLLLRWAYDVESAINKHSRRAFSTPGPQSRVSSVDHFYTSHHVCILAGAPFSPMLWSALRCSAVHQLFRLIGPLYTHSYR